MIDVDIVVGSVFFVGGCVVDEEVNDIGINDGEGDVDLSSGFVYEVECFWFWLW